MRTFRLGPLSACPTRSTSARSCWPGAVSIMVMVVQKDLGSSLLFFTLFVVMLWVATARPSYLVVGAGLFAGARLPVVADVRPRAGAGRRSGSTRGRTRRQGLPDRARAGSPWPTAGSPAPGSASATRTASPTSRPTSSSSPSAEELGLFGAHAGPRRLPAAWSAPACASRPGPSTPSTSCWPSASPRCSASRPSSSSAGSSGCCRSPASPCRSSSYGGSSLVVELDPARAAAADLRREPAGRAAEKLDAMAVSRREHPDPPARHRPARLLRRAVRDAQLDPGLPQGQPRRPTRSTPLQVKQDFNKPRGTITSADGALLAESVDVPDADGSSSASAPIPRATCSRQITGFYSFRFGSTGLERTYNDELAGQTIGQQVRGFADLLNPRPQVGNLTIIGAQGPPAGGQATRSATREGSVVAIDPKTGEILAFWSYPSYDPNLVSTNDQDAGDGGLGRCYNAAPGQPLRAHQYQERYFPGSTFKVVTGSTGAADRHGHPRRPVVPGGHQLHPAADRPSPISNFGGEACGGTLCRHPAGVVQLGVRPDGHRDDRPRPDDRRRRVVRVQRRSRRSTCPAPAASVFPTDFTRQPARPGPVVDRPERRAGHPAADGAGRRRHRQRRRDHEAPRA